MKKIYKLNYFNWILAIIATSLLSSCVSPKETNLLQQNEPIYPAKDFEEYKLQVNDEVECIIMTDNAELSNSFNGIISSSTQSSSTSANNSYIVYQNGMISIPFFGNIKVEKLTVSEAESVIERKMKESFPDAQVRLRLKNNIFYIVSNGKNGQFNVIKENMTIYQALAVSGNIDTKIDLRQVKILRNEDGRDIIKTFNLKTESVIESEFYYIKPNDVIYYTTSNSSFFRTESVTSLVGTIVAPISFLLGMVAWKFW